MTTQLIVAATIRAELARRNCPQRLLAEHLGKTQPTLSRQLLGQQDFKLTELIQISEFFGMELEDLVKLPAGVK